MPQRWRHRGRKEHSFQALEQHFQAGAKWCVATFHIGWLLHGQLFFVQSQHGKIRGQIKLVIMHICRHALTWLPLSPVIIVFSPDF